jgi:hypothetical protein
MALSGLMLLTGTFSAYSCEHGRSPSALKLNLRHENIPRDIAPPGAAVSSQRIDIFFLKLYFNLTPFINNTNCKIKL